MLKLIQPNKFTIYRVIDHTNGKIYVGQTTKKNPNDRWDSHKYAAIRGEESLFYNAMRKHGIENFSFEIIDQCHPNKGLLNVLEILAVIENNSHMSTGRGYNMTWGGEGGGYALGKHWKNSEETKKKRRLYYDTHPRPRSGEIRTEEEKAYLRKINSKELHPQWGLTGEKCPTYKKYRIYFEDGRIIEVHGLRKWCRENNYQNSCIIRVCDGKQPYHKDIIKVERLT